jgi:hypothetical protein
MTPASLSEPDLTEAVRLLNLTPKWHTIRFIRGCQAGAGAISIKVVSIDALQHKTKSHGVVCTHAGCDSPGPGCAYGAPRRGAPSPMELGYPNCGLSVHRRT